MTKHKVTAEEKALFREACRDVVPLKAAAQAPSIGSKHQAYKLKKQPQANFSPTPTTAPREVILGLRDYPQLDPDSVLSYKNPSVSETIWKRLKQGKIEIGQRLDLHGLSIAEAVERLQIALHHSTIRQHKCVLIIHGKGKQQTPERITLKRFLNVWLRDKKEVLGFISAQSKHGGTGAIYVLLRHFKSEGMR